MASEIDNIVFDRSKTIYDHGKVRRVHIIGAGGVGSWASITFAMAGCPEIHVYDDDELGLTNLNRLPFTFDDIGKQKTKVIQEFIGKIRPEAKVVPHMGVFSKDDISAVENGDVVIIGVDSAQVNNNILELLRDKEARILRGAYDGDKVVVMDAGFQWENKDEQPQRGYRIVASYVVPPMIVAAMLVEKAYRHDEVEINGVEVHKMIGGVSNDRV